jgi:DNA ligase (NAD+)
MFTEINFHIEELEYLKKLGFQTNPLNKKVNGIKEAWSYAQEINKKRSTLAYQIDGVVVKINNRNTKELAGVVGKTPRAWCAIKFPGDEVVTKLVDVTWQVGRSGKITPVAELEPVTIQGSQVQRATLHNYKVFKNLNLSKGDLVVIHKAGDIIPEVIKVLKMNSKTDQDFNTKEIN